MDRFPSSWKNCATCVFWVANRDVDSFCSYVILDSRQEKGKCMCRSSGWFRSQREGASQCPSYQKWPVLN